MQFVKSELRKGTGTTLPVQLDRRAVTNMQDAGAKNDAAAKGWPALSATTSYLQNITNIPQAVLSLFASNNARITQTEVGRRRRATSGVSLPGSR
jgi:hypothetical protein